MELKGRFKVIAAKPAKNGRGTYYDLGDIDTFSKINIALTDKLEFGKTYELTLEVALKQGKFGSYFEPVNAVPAVPAVVQPNKNP